MAFLCGASLRALEGCSVLFSLFVWFSTPPGETNTGPGFNRGSGGGAQGCGFEERARASARTEGGSAI
jgi:hypothetical protein